VKQSIGRTIIFILLVFLIIPPPHAGSCTTFCLNEGGRIVFGRNYDWSVGICFLMTNKRGLEKTAFLEASENPASWVSLYGSLTFNQYGREFPMGGINEAGLVVELMMLTDTRFPAPDERPAVPELSWIQYQLDNHKTVSEVIAGNAHIRIHQDGVPIHFLVCDRTGQSAAIEFLEGEMVCHTKESLPVPALTNSTYAESLDFLKRHRGWGGDRDLTHSHGSLDRFVQVANMTRRYGETEKPPLIDYAFGMLDSVNVKDHTQWSIVYDIPTLTVYFKTLSSPVLKRVKLNDFDLDCDTPVMWLDADTDHTEDVGRFFTPYCTRINRNLIYKAYRQTEFLKKTPVEAVDQAARYPESLICRKKRL